jgi:3-oxoacyl-[acyl-carrier protein] reductase
MRFSGRVAVVTGGARGIGKAVVTRLAVEGASVVIADILRQTAEAAAKELEAAGRTVMPMPVDVTDPASVVELVRAALARFGRLDILINNAGIMGDVVPIRDMPDAEWHRVLGINLHGVFNCSKAVIPVMTAQRYGRIVSLSSVAGKEGNARMAAYSVSKAGVIALTKSLAKELVLDGVTVNCVTPALTNTDMIKGYRPEQLALLLSKVPMNRVADPAEIAAVICFLASEEASFVTGAVYDVSGGRSDY